MKLIYENDIPDMPDDIVYAEDLVANELYLTPQGLRPRWKPNGITDNREEWKQKYNIFQNITGCYTHDSTREFLKEYRETCLYYSGLATELHMEAKES